MLLALICASALQAGEPRAVASRLSEVTVFTDRALVQREIELPQASGRFLIAGLPAALDAESLRTRCTGAQVVGLETRERFQSAVPDARIEELRRNLRGLERELQALQDERQVLRDVAAHLNALLKPPAAEKQAENAGESSLAAWRANLEFLSSELAGNAARMRDSEWKIAAAEQRLAAARLELDSVNTGAGVNLRDVIVSVEGGGAARLELEYLVANAGWRPMYDLRTASNATSVELSYRAQVWQQSGEDWNDVELALSTAEPRRGAQGPDPEPIWLRIDERDKYARERKGSAALSLEGLGYTGGTADAARPFAQVERHGLSVRFRLASRDTIPSRAEPSSVLVGQTTLAVTPEYFATPSLDSNVWLRGKTLNTSEWTLLAGRAAVFFGADYLGTAEIGEVQPGAELTLHLGVDPALSVERAELEDTTSQPGLFGSKAARKQAFRVHLKNNGAAAARADGSALVYVREALPRTTDDRIKVELAESKPAALADERWVKEREELGLVTWGLLVPKSGDTALTYAIKISYPEGARVLER